MEPPKQEPTFEESIKQVMQTLPPPIKQYLEQKKYSAVVSRMMTKYTLHIDQAGVLEREIMLLLMGIDNPAEFAQALVGEAKLDQQVASGITKDVNEQIFIPLREEMRKGPPAPEATRSSPKPVQGTAPTNVSVPKYFHLQNKIPVPTSTAPALPRTATPSAGPSLKEVLAAVTRASSETSQGTAKEVPKPAGTTKLLGDHEEPHLELKKTEPPPNLPGAILHPPLPTPPKAPPPLLPKPITPVAPYSSDPYREPIE